MGRLDHLFELQQAHLGDLLKKRNVNGVGIGVRVRDDVITDEYVIGVTVDDKCAAGDLAAADVVPDELEVDFGGTTIRAKTDIVVLKQPDTEADYPATPPYGSRKRPLQSGYSLSGAAGNMLRQGTLGCFVEVDGRIQALTNHHVVQLHPLTPVAQDVLQPGLLDNGKKEDTIGRAGKFVQLTPDKVHGMDAALVLLNPGERIDTSVPVTGALRGWYPYLNVLWKARLVGRTSGYVEAHCIQSAWAGALLHDGSWVKFNGQQIMKVQPTGLASKPGDSGGIWVTMDNCVGLLTHGFYPVLDYAVATPIGSVLEVFGARLRVSAESASEAAEQMPIDDPDFSPEVLKRIQAMSVNEVMEP